MKKNAKDISDLVIVIISICIVLLGLILSLTISLKYGFVHHSLIDDIFSIIKT